MSIYMSISYFDIYIYICIYVYLILTRLQARQNTAQLVKILSDTTNQNV